VQCSHHIVHFEQFMDSTLIQRPTGWKGKLPSYQAVCRCCQRSQNEQETCCNNCIANVVVRLCQLSNCLCCCLLHLLLWCPQQCCSWGNIPARLAEIKLLHSFIHYTRDFPEGQVRTVLISSLYEVLFWQLAYQQ